MALKNMTPSPFIRCFYGKFTDVITEQTNLIFLQTQVIKY